MIGSVGIVWVVFESTVLSGLRSFGVELNSDSVGGEWWSISSSLLAGMIGEAGTGSLELGTCGMMVLSGVLDRPRLAARSTPFWAAVGSSQAR